MSSVRVPGGSDRLHSNLDNTLLSPYRAIQPWTTFTAPFRPQAGEDGWIDTVKNKELKKKQESVRAESFNVAFKLPCNADISAFFSPISLCRLVCAPQSVFLSVVRPSGQL